MNELLIVIHFGFKDHGHLLMSFFSRKKLLFVGGSLAAGSRQLRDFAPRDKLGTGGQLLQLGTRN
jgi:hypothetical protein